MRRPSPLPVPESRPADPADPVGPPIDDVAPDIAQYPDAVAPASAAEPDAVTAPILLPGLVQGGGSEGAPATGPASDTAPGTAAVAPPVISTSGPAPAPEQQGELDADSVRLRDVWAASRARRKALRAEVRRFTVRARRRRAVWIGAAASLLLLVLGSLGAAYSPLFAVENIRVVGAEQLDSAAVEAALADQIGTPLPRVDASAVKAALVAFPLIETYALEARPPHDLVLRVVERTPIGVIESAAGFTLVDAAGVALSTTAAAPAGQPVLTVKGGPKSDAFGAVGLVMRALPEPIRVQVTAVAATSPDDVILTLGGTNTQVVWGNAEDSAMKVVVLEKTMVAKPPADVSVYDVSSPAAIVVR